MSSELWEVIMEKEGKEIARHGPYSTEEKAENIMLCLKMKFPDAKWKYVRNPRSFQSDKCSIVLRKVEIDCDYDKIMRVHLMKEGGNVGVTTNCPVAKPPSESQAKKPVPKKRKNNEK